MVRNGYALRNSRTIEKIEALIDSIDYKSATITIITNDATYTLEKNNKKPMGFNS